MRTTFLIFFGLALGLSRALFADLPPDEVHQCTRHGIICDVLDSPTAAPFIYKPGKICPIQRQDLKSVRVPYWANETQLKMGMLIVHQDIAERVRDIFVEIAMSSSPERVIYRIDEIMQTFDGDDAHSMAANNTSSFNCRTTPGSSRLSQHAYGLAIDINPLWNPYVKTRKGQTTVLPPEGRLYDGVTAERDPKDSRLLRADHLIVTTFKKYGFKWGGDWRSLKDYQHFEIETKK